MCWGDRRFAKMQQLEVQWGQLVTKNLEIDVACTRLEAELSAAAAAAPQ